MRVFLETIIAFSAGFCFNMWVSENLKGILSVEQVFLTIVSGPICSLAASVTVSTVIDKGNKSISNKGLRTSRV
jgi:hypothetical protein